MVMNEPKYFDIVKVRVDAPILKETFRGRIQKNLNARKKIWQLKWKFLDLTLGGLLLYGLIVIVAFSGAIATTRIISATISQKPVLEVSPSFSDFKVEKLKPTNQQTDHQPSTSQPSVAQSIEQDPFKMIAEPATDEIAKNSFKIRILNGNARDGEAGKIKNELTANGFSVGAVGNAKNQYPTTQIYYLAGKNKSAEKVKSALSKYQAETHESNVGLIGDGYDILVVLGVK
ncbi:MAG: hypothetical protein CEN89_580 [Candidatus Berkelbacteria bacterium Licking1014_7]|uniref:LytR/CpsA/Psr regulator C-terminal domain-containing protein n=1 Tax=Candidatus Berkelbacteria bacterium Licking1014_7 TaxID=2017147 RepID=A0A554LIF7_9BACT|nr:MAG: hypothetical protein CEN89_580 [Candidatus Berkelbacteria bacterium Licking1014_7]